MSKILDDVEEFLGVNNFTFIREIIPQRKIPKITNGSRVLHPIFVLPTSHKLPLVYDIHTFIGL